MNEVRHSFPLISCWKSQIFPLSMLCHACTRLFAGRAENASTEERDQIYKMHHPDVASFRLANDLGCGICSKAWRNFGPTREGSDIHVLMTATALPVQLSGTRKMNVLQLDYWNRQDYNGQTQMILSMDHGISEGQWIRVRGAWYLHLRIIGFEMIPTGIVHFPPSHAPKTKYSQIESTVDRSKILEAALIPFRVIALLESGWGAARTIIVPAKLIKLTSSLIACWILDSGEIKS